MRYYFHTEAVNICSGLKVDSAFDPRPKTSSYLPIQRPTFNMVLFGSSRDGAVESSPRTLPNEILYLIIENCARLDLFACCFVNKAMYVVSVAYIYRDPFAYRPVRIERVDLRSNSEEYTDDVNDGPLNSAKLCRTILETPRIAQLVRKYHTVIWNSHVLEQEMARKVIPCLTSLAEAELSFPDDTLFISLCQLQLQHVMLHRGPPNVGGAEAFWYWLEEQRDIRQLCMSSEILPRLSPFALPRLEWLEASPQAARVVLPNTTIRKYTGKENWRHRWGRQDIAEVIPLMGQSLHHVKNVYVSAVDVNILFQVFRQHCPYLRTIDLNVSQGVNEQPVLSSAILLAVHGLPHLECLHIVMPDHVDVAVLMEFATLMTKTCPALCHVIWTADPRLFFIEPVVQRLKLVHGRWEVVRSLLPEVIPTPWRFVDVEKQ
ncbi:hypothetical protein FRB94_005680 [Tulasnella sp. JGI-2019a]|nr:hypothetical protein FRB94_005680 [Tulasnella sp. JGI-2019a]